MKLMSALSTAIGVALLLASSVCARTVDLNDANFEDEVSKQPSFVMFFAPWCGHCQRMKPEWEKLVEAYANHNEILIGSVDCDQYKDTATKYKVGGYPTIKYFDGKGGEPVDFKSDLSLEKFVEFVNEQTGATVKVKKPVDTVRELDAESFKADVENRNKKNYFVVFHASWCGHCKHLIPKLPKLAAAFVGDDTVEIVKIDADKHSEIGAKYGVQGYPTLKLFLAGDDKTTVPYEFAREPQDMLDFINKHLGTHRTIDGAFDTGAWPSTEIKDLVAKFRKADKTEKASIVKKAAEAAKAATGRFSTYAHFYPKLMRKAMDNPNFLNTEPDRLEKLLENKMGDEPKLNALYRLAILKQLNGATEPSVATSDDGKDEL